MRGFCMRKGKYMKGKMKTCAFFGDWDVPYTVALRALIIEILEKEIKEKDIKRFIFGSRNKFQDLCLETVYILKKKYPKIKLCYLASQEIFIDATYREQLSAFSRRKKGKGCASYLERAFELVEKSDICVFYMDREKTKSKDMQAIYEFALEQVTEGKELIVL